MQDDAGRENDTSIDGERELSTSSQGFVTLGGYAIPLLNTESKTKVQSLSVNELISGGVPEAKDEVNRNGSTGAKTQEEQHDRHDDAATMDLLDQGRRQFASLSRQHAALIVIDVLSRLALLLYVELFTGWMTTQSGRAVVSLFVLLWTVLYAGMGHGKFLLLFHTHNVQVHQDHIWEVYTANLQRAARLTEETSRALSSLLADRRRRAEAQEPVSASTDAKDKNV